MKHFISVDDIGDPHRLADEALMLKENTFMDQHLGEHKVLGLIFFNTSLRTRMATTRAAYNLGMKVMILNVSKDSWQMEVEEGTVMDGGKAEHVKEAIPVMASYCNVMGVRSFPGLKDRDHDYREVMLRAFVNYASCPVINLESATLHPLQSLADLMTIKEFAVKKKPKIVLTWAPHIKALPQSVANSFAQWMEAAKMDLTIAHPEGMDLAPEFVAQAKVTHKQEDALEGADFVYVKSWASWHDYGKICTDERWMITKAKMDLTNNARLMHCLPVRRNVVISDDALDSDHSIVREQAYNRLYATQVVLKKLIL